MHTVNGMGLWAVVSCCYIRYKYRKRFMVFGFAYGSLNMPRYWPLHKTPSIHRTHHTSHMQFLATKTALNYSLEANKQKNGEKFFSAGSMPAFYMHFAYPYSPIYKSHKHRVISASAVESKQLKAIQTGSSIHIHKM